MYPNKHYYYWNSYRSWTGQPVAIGRVDKSNPQAVKRWLEPLVKRLGVSVIVTDDLASYRVVAEKLEVEHQVCQFHVRRWVGRTLYELKETVPKEWLQVLDEVKKKGLMRCRRRENRLLLNILGI